eukprot:4508806-Pyramimonas_sp.AAC.1
MVWSPVRSLAIDLSLTLAHSTMTAGLVPSGVATPLALLGKLPLTAAFDTIYVYSSELFETPIRNRVMGMCRCVPTNNIPSTLIPQPNHSRRCCGGVIGCLSGF